MSRVPATCILCGDPGYLCDIRDGAQHQPGFAVPERHRQAVFCEWCRDLMSSGWAAITEVGVSLL